MKIQLALCHAEIESYIAKNFRLELVDTASCLEELFETVAATAAETLILSNHFIGSSDRKKTIDRIAAVRPDIRILYLYGAPDSDSESFIRYLQSKKVYDYHIGAQITSLEIEKLIFGNREEYRSDRKAFFHSKPKAIWYRELDKAVITIYSNCTNGKSHLAWNLSAAFADKGYITTLINLDRGYSANIHFGIEDIYHELLAHTITQNTYKSILENCFKKGRLNVITGKLGVEEPITQEEFLKLLYFVRSKSDIVIIDTYSGLTDITLQAIGSSTIDFLVFDCDLMHFHMNKQLLQQLGSNLMEDKTYALINNGVASSEAYKYIYKQIHMLGIDFKGILPISSCGMASCELMYTGKTPYEASKSSDNMIMDIDNLLSAINAGKKERPLINNLNRRGIR